MKQHYVYIMINSIDGKPFYVGKGTGNRAFHHHQPSNQAYNPIKTKKMNSILEQKGDILFEIYFCVDEEEAFSYEKWLIQQYGKVQNGTGILTNIDDGGRGGSSGRIISTETRKKLKERPKQFHTSSVRQRISKNKQGEPKTDEVKQKIQQSITKNNFTVCQYDLHENLLSTFPSARAAYKATGVDNSQISLCCRGKYPTAGGYVWKYENETINRRKEPVCVEQVDSLGNVVNTFKSISQAAKALNTSVPFISRACKDPTKTAVGFSWRIISFQREK